MTRGSLGVSIGNIVGSNFFNLTAIVGAAALVRPLVVSEAALTALVWLVGVTFAVIVVLWTGRVLSRLEGTLLALSEVARWILGIIG